MVNAVHRPQFGGIKVREEPRSAPLPINRRMELNTLRDLYIHELKDLYSAEKQIIKALPKMVKAASNKQLSAAFAQHLEQTKKQAERLEEILASHNETTRGPKCEGMEGVLKEGDEMMMEDGEDEVRDAGLIAAAQRVEHYEIAGYGCAKTYAQLLGHKDDVKILQQSLDEEGATDKKLTKIAKAVINIKAMAPAPKNGKAKKSPVKRATKAVKEAVEKVTS